MVESKEYSWRWVTADVLLSRRACELVYAKLTPATAAGLCIFYDGENANGEEIIQLETGGLYNCEFAPPKPIYCRRGLYVGTVTTVEGIFVQWREIPQGIGHED